ncbi:MAG: FAD binding domain-containing protein [Tuberibacillus sp.]
MQANARYYQPTRVEEAVFLFNELKKAQKNPAYVAGGTELITLSRLHLFETGAFIDITHLQDCLIHEFQDSKLVIGSCVTLNQIAEKNLFPLLAVTGYRVADHTARNQITLGGNMAGKIIYKEAILPLLITESILVIAGIHGYRVVPITDIFRKRLLLEDGELVLQVRTEKDLLGQPFYSVKKRKIDVIDYPLLTLAAIKLGDQIRVAVSGLCDFPFRSREMEWLLNDKNKTVDARIEEALVQLPGPVRNDWIASAEYRLFVFKNTLQDMFAALEVE